MFDFFKKVKERKSELIGEKTILSTSEEHKRECENKERKRIEYRTCPECSHESTFNYMGERDLGFRKYKCYQCDECGCKWEVRVK